MIFTIVYHQLYEVAKFVSKEFSDTDMADFPVTALVGQRLKALRLKKGLTEQGICKKLQMNTGDFSKLENGISGIPFWRLAEIAEFFNVDVHDLLIEKGSPGVYELRQEVEFLARMNIQQAQEIVRLQRKVIELYSGLCT